MVSLEPNCNFPSESKSSQEDPVIQTPHAPRILPFAESNQQVCSDQSVCNKVRPFVPSVGQTYVSVNQEQEDRFQFNSIINWFQAHKLAFKAAAVMRTNNHEFIADMVAQNFRYAELLEPILNRNPDWTEELERRIGWVTYLIEDILTKPYQKN